MEDVDSQGQDRTGGNQVATGEQPLVIPQGNQGGANQSIVQGDRSGATTSTRVRVQNIEDTSGYDSNFDYARSTRSACRNSSRGFTQIPFDYSNLSFNHSLSSPHLGKIPQFDGVNYFKWKGSMEEYLMAVNPALWNIVEVGVNIPRDGTPLTQEHGNIIQRNYQALRIIKSSLSGEEYEKVDGLKTAMEVWDTLQVDYQGTKQVREGGIRALKRELNRFVIRDKETPQEMYNRLNKIINQSRL